MEISPDVQLIGKSASELYEQQIHDLRKQLSVLEMMEKDYVTEIEIQQRKYEGDITAERAKLKAVEEKNILTVKELLNKIESLEQDKKSDSEYYQRKIVELEEKVKKMEEQLKLSNSNNMDNLQQLQCENKELKGKISDLYEECLQQQEQAVACSRREDDMHINLLELRELNSVQKEELTSKADTIMRLKDELALLKSELGMLKSKPQDEIKKGNSLFAEVEDKRQSMKKNLENAILKYHQMKKLYMEKCIEASKFRADYVFLSRKYVEIETTLKEEDAHLINSYKSHIKILEEDLEKLKQEKSPIFPNDEKAAFKSMKAYVEYCRIENEKVKTELEEQYMKALFSNQTLHNLQRELHKSEIELIQAKGQITELQGLLHENQGKSDEDIQERPSVS